MPRSVRTDHDGAWHHVMNRGASHADIFLDDVDRETFLSCIARAIEPTGIEIHGYCLMSNHYHLLVFSPSGTLSAFMQQHSGRYTRMFNRRHRMDGAIFRARYKSVTIGSDSQLLQTSRYIHLNPIVARLATVAADWPWSSAGAFLGRTQPPVWLNAKVLLEMFSGAAPAADYAAFLKDGLDVGTVEFYGNLKWN